MRLSNKAAKFIFASTAVLLFSVSYILYQQIRSLLNSQQQLNESTLVKLKLEETLSALKDEEAAQRGFLLAKDSVFLQPYFGAYERSRTLLSQLKYLTARNLPQQNDISAMQVLVELRFKTFNQVIDQYNQPNINEETRKSHLLRGKSVMDSIRMYVQKIEGRENELVTATETARKKYEFLTPLFGVLLMMIAIGILIFSYGKISEQLNRMQRLFIQFRIMNNRLKQKNRQLEMYNKELDSFTYIASHDLKEPLRKIFTYASLIEDNESHGLSYDNKQHFRRIKLAAQRMQNLLNDLLMYSHVTMGDKQFEEVDLNKVVQDVASNLKEEITENDACIKVSTLPVVKAMPFQIRQLFENLITNSLKYKQHQVSPCIVIESAVLEKNQIREPFHKESDCYHKLYFRDNGLGFEQSYSEKIFKLFQRLHTTSGQTGTGIGLTICKKIVDNHHGFIKATSEVNKGTTFEIYLPC